MPPVRNSKKDIYTGGADWFAESFVGQYLVYRPFKPQWYPEEKPGFEVPEKYRGSISPTNTLVDDHEAREKADLKKGETFPEAIEDPEDPALGPMRQVDLEKAAQKPSDQSAETSEKDKEEDPVQKAAKEKGYIVVDWYGENDPANPMNWSLFKKNLFTLQICVLTFSIYIGSAIYAPGYLSLEAEFGVSQIVASLGLSLFVFGYGSGPLFLAPLSEIPQIGRNLPYIVTLAIFVILQVPSALVTNIQGLLVLRFLAGFIGSPVLATGGASLGDIFDIKTRPYAIGIWGLAAVCGPVLGPLLGGFAIQAHDWRWAFWILLWLDGACLLFLSFFMPETSSSNILTRRAQRLRKLTGNDKLRSPGEIQGESMGPKDIAMMTLVMPFWLSFSEPICLVLNLYIGLVYSILYCFIESFNLVFAEMYGFNLGENGLAFMGLFVGAVVTYIAYCFYNAYIQIPTIRKQNGILHPEQRLPVACVCAFALPICLFWFGWTSNPSIHWIVPIIGSAFFSVGAFGLFQAVLNYLGDAYPANAASVYAGNDCFRSFMGGAFPIFSSQMFRNLGHGVAWGCTLLGCISLLFLPAPFIFHKYGKRLRMRSKYARHDI